MTDPVEYWQQAAARATTNCEAIIESQRECIAELQRRCQELLYERTMMRASNAMDFRDFCLNSAVHGAVPLEAVLSYLHEATDGLVPAPESRRKRCRPDPVACHSSLPSFSGPTPSSPDLVPPTFSSSSSILSSDPVQQQQQQLLLTNVAFRTGPPLSPRTRALQRVLFLNRRRLREGDALVGAVDVAPSSMAGDRASVVPVAAGQSFKHNATKTPHHPPQQEQKRLVS